MSPDSKSHITSTGLQSLVRLDTVDLILQCAGLTLPGLFGAVGSVAVAISLRYGVGLLGVRHREHPLSALPQIHTNTSICRLKGSLLHYGSRGDQVHCRAQNEMLSEEV